MLFSKARAGLVCWIKVTTAFGICDYEIRIMIDLSIPVVDRNEEK
jgi:hypothetical protein